MILTKIEIVHFGKLNNVSFDLKDNLDIFQGDNEAGKSTTVAFIKQVIFGFYLKNAKTASFFEDYSPLSRVSPMGGSLTFKDGEDKYVLTRLYVKGDSKKGILNVTLNGKQVPAKTFFKKIQNISPQFYADSFIFNQDTLREITRLSQEQLMERIYFLGAAESSKLIELRDNFEKQAGELFKKAGRKPEINTLLTQIKAQDKKVSATNKKFEQYRNFELELNKLTRQKNDAQIELKQIQKQVQKLNALKQQLLNYREYQKLKLQVKSISFFQKDFDDAQRLAIEINSLTLSLQKLEEQAGKISQELDDNSVNLQNLVDQKAQILQWQSELKQAKQKIKNLQKELSQLQIYQANAFKLLKMSEEQRQELKANYQKAQEQIKRESLNRNQYLTIIGIALVAIGLILCFIVTPVCVLLSAIGAFLIWKSAHNSRLKPNWVDIFNKKYQINLNDFDYNTTINQMLQLQSREQDLDDNQKNESELETDLQQIIERLRQVGYSISNFDEIIPALNQIQNRINEISQKQRHLQDLSIQEKQLQHDINTHQTELNQIYAKNKLTSLAEFKNLATQAQKQEKLNLHLKALQNSMKDDLTQLEKITPNESEFMQKLTQANNKLSNKQDEFNNLQEQVAQIKAEMVQLVDSSAVFDEKQILANMKAQLREKSIQYLADLAAAHWIAVSLDLASNGRFPKMLKSATEYFKLLTGGRYIDLEIGKKIKVISKNKRKYDVKYLSRGTSEQLYFALKLAFVEQISDKIELPILIDDAFVDFDNQRTGYIVQLLKKLSQKSQVLIFTQKEELASLLNLKPLELKTEEV